MLIASPTDPKLQSCETWERYLILTCVRMYRLAPAAAVEEQPQMRVSSLPPMMKLKDKLYQKNEKLYKSFGMFDLNKVGSVTTAEFAKTVEDLNVSFPPLPLLPDIWHSANNTPPIKIWGLDGRLGTLMAVAPINRLLVVSFACIQCTFKCVHYGPASLSSPALAW